VFLSSLISFWSDLLGFTRIWSHRPGFPSSVSGPARAAKIAGLGRPRTRSNLGGEFCIWLYALIFTDIHLYWVGLNRRLPGPFSAECGISSAELCLQFPPSAFMGRPTCTREGRGSSRVAGQLMPPTLPRRSLGEGGRPLSPFPLQTLKEQARERRTTATIPRFNGTASKKWQIFSVGRRLFRNLSGGTCKLLSLCGLSGDTCIEITVEQSGGASSSGQQLPSYPPFRAS